MAESVIPPPPPGFELDSAARTPPPPPAGFVLDVVAGKKGAGVSAVPKVNHTPTLAEIGMAGSPPGGPPREDDEEEGLAVPGAKEPAALPGALLAGLLSDPAGAPSAPAGMFARGDAKVANYGPNDAPKTKAEAAERAEWETARQLRQIALERGPAPFGGTDAGPGVLVPMGVSGAVHLTSLLRKVFWDGGGKVVGALAHPIESGRTFGAAVAHPLRTVDSAIEAVTREVSAKEEGLLRREAKVKGTTYEKLLEQRRAERGLPARGEKVPIEMAPVSAAVRDGLGRYVPLAPFIVPGL